MKDFYQKKFRNKSDEELKFIIDHPDDMDPDAISVAKALLTERKAGNRVVATRHYGREVMDELNRQKLRKAFRKYMKTFDFMTLLAAITAAVIMLAAFHFALYFLRNQNTDFTWFIILIYISGFAIGHIFYRIFKKVDHGFYGRLLQDCIYQIIISILVSIELQVIAVNTEFTFSINTLWMNTLVLLLLIPILEIVLSLFNSLLKLFRIHLW